ncbi:MAG: ribonuclease E/G [Armatimonadetes bacterium]|nr:ribonuclease E/G [Armatimonadota bacterium]
MQRLAIDDRATYERALDLLSHMAPELRDRVELHDEDIPIFVKYGVEREIDRALRPRVWLPHGGHISIEETEALTAVDVNSGRFTSRSSLEDTILQTNLEAAEEIARQLRLRDIGGIIVIDFIDMQKARHRQQVLRVFRDALARDRMRTRVMHITRLGLLEMTRKRTDVSLSHILQDECPHCGGTGRILNATFVAERVLTDLMILAKDSKAEAFAVLVDPHVALCLVGPEGAIAEKIEKEKLGRPVLVRTRKHLRRDYCEITPGKLSTLEKQFGFLIPGDIVEVRPEDMVDVPHSCPLAMLRGVIVEIPDVAVPLKAPIRVRITRAGRSYGRATVV